MGKSKIVRKLKEVDLMWKVFMTVLIILIGAIWSWATTFSTNTTVEGWFKANELYVTDTTYRIYVDGNDLKFKDVTGGPYTLAQLVADTQNTYTAGDGLDLTSFEFALDLKTGTPLKITSTELDMTVASSGVDGYLSGTDWSTFNSKQATMSGGTGITLNGAEINSDAATDAQVGHVTTSAQTFAGKKTFNAGVAIPEGQKIWLATNTYLICGATEAAAYLYVNDICKVKWE